MRIYRYLVGSLCTIFIFSLPGSAVSAGLSNNDHLSPGWHHGAFMEIFVRGYKDSDGDGIGDLRGLTQSLDYLQDLGIKGIWLMPITASSDHDHGYATTDYRGIEPAYGTLADLDELLREAHARGIGIITDYVINHSSASHPLFIDSASARDSKYRNWYVWQDTAPTGWNIWGKNPWTETPNGALFATFGPHMPDFNLRNPDVIKHHFDNLRFWLDLGLDGFRFDAVPHMIENTASDWNDQPESRALTTKLRELVSSYGSRFSVCEATANPIAYGAADICGSAFAFGFEKHVALAAQGDKTAIKAIAEYFIKAPPGMATMVSNHDIFAGKRLWDQVGGDLVKYRLAAATYLLQPGTPFIYYGEEIGMAGVNELQGDEPLRTPMSWTNASATAGFTSGTPFRPVSPNATTFNAQAQAGNPNSLHSFYKAMLHLRNSLPSIARGSYQAPWVTGRVMSFQRKLDTEHTLVLINYSRRAVRLRVPQLPAGSLMSPRYPPQSSAFLANGRGTASVRLAAQSVYVYRIEPN